MSVSHHGDDAEAIKRFMDQMNGTARRSYPAGRMGAKDDGELAYAVAADPAHGTVIIRFGKPVEWIAMSAKDVEQLREKLLEKVVALQTGE